MGIIGNCSYLAYIDTSAAIKWACMPRFDSSFVFGSLLDENKGGHFSVSPSKKAIENRQYYLENTNILCTEFTTEDGRYRVIDFAPRFYQYDRYYRPLMICRKIERIAGRPSIKVTCSPVGDYGKTKPEILIGSNHIRYLGIGDQVRLTTNIPLNTIVNEQSFILSEDKYLAFTYGEPLEAPLIETMETFYTKTRSYWMNWIKSTSIPNFYQKEIIRSALVLKLHQYEDTGGIIASGTTSLPEADKSTRNWDYRYCWMRDAYYTLMAFNSIGHFEELEKYFLYIENIVLNEESRIQPLYSIIGEKNLTENIIDLDGYLGNTPVRIGNDAYTHIQNDVYGQLLVSILPIFTDKRLNTNIKYHSKKIVELLLSKIESKINEPDAGLWEFRNRKQYHTYTYLFHWAGCKAAQKIAHAFNDSDLMKKAEMLANLASDYIERSYSIEKMAYTQAVDVSHLDASGLNLVLMNYLDPNSERAISHIEAHKKELMTDQGLFYRYRHEDDFGKPDTTFFVCSFWFAEALASTNQIDSAIEYFENLLKYSNHLGLFSEDVDINGGQWGNFPQTYSHVGLINTAFRIAKKLDYPIFYSK